MRAHHPHPSTSTSTSGSGFALGFGFALHAFVLALGLSLALPALADAQSRSARRGGRSPVPDQGMVAVGGSAGVFVPSDDFESAPFVEGFGEYYLTPRVSLRGRVAFTDPGLEIEHADSLRHLQFGFDAIYNWEKGKWHPFVGGGLGANVLQPKDNGHSFGDSETKPSVNAIGGVEYFLNRRVSLKAEGRLQFLDDVFGRDPSGLALSFGVKRYF